MFLKVRPNVQWVLLLLGLIFGLEASVFGLKASSQVFSNDGSFQLSPFVSAILPITFLEPTFFGPQSGIGEVGEYHRFIILAESYKNLSIYKDFEYTNEDEMKGYEFVIGQRYQYE